MLQEITAKTPRHNLKIEVRSGHIPTKDVKTDRKLFSDMCRTGCKNYGTKHSCPPSSPALENHVKEKYLFVIMMSIDLTQLKEYKEYHRVRLANAVLKSRIEKLMRTLEINSRFLSTGSCRLCKPCQKKKGEPCKHPDKMRYSMESLGIDCNHLCSTLFNKPLQWRRKGTEIEYTSVVCAIPSESPKSLKINKSH
ncbi:MAG: DUF2284 domain-containing protein [archaeon]